MSEAKEHGELPTQDVEVGELQPEDYARATQLIRETIEESWRGERSPRLLGELQAKYTPQTLSQRQSESTMWLATDSVTRDALGIIALKHNELRTFYVHPSAQRKGVGRKLFEALKARALAEGLTKIRLEASTNGQPVYEKFGFKKVGTIQKERGGEQYEDAAMELDLTENPTE